MWSLECPQIPIMFPLITMIHVDIIAEPQAARPQATQNSAYWESLTALMETIREVKTQQHGEDQNSGNKQK